MENYQVEARLVRWTARNLAFNLRCIPEDRLDWSPAPGVKSARAIIAEVIGAMDEMLPVFEGGVWQQGQVPHLASLEEAERLLFETADRYAGALDAAGPALDRPITVRGATWWGTGVVLFPVIDMMHHHGQIAYIQTLLGDRDSHFDMVASAEAFGRPADPA